MASFWWRIIQSLLFYFLEHRERFSKSSRDYILPSPALAVMVVNSKETESEYNKSKLLPIILNRNSLLIWTQFLRKITWKYWFGKCLGNLHSRWWSFVSLELPVFLLIVDYAIKIKFRNKNILTKVFPHDVETHWNFFRNWNNIFKLIV